MGTLSRQVLTAREESKARAHVGPINGLSVDVEDYFHAEALGQCVKREQWDSMESRVVSNTQRVLELFSRHSVLATFFVLGWVAERFPNLVREIKAAGHEVGCHSYWHRLIHQLTPDEFRADTRRAKEAIEDAAGEQVIGYRAPTFSITRRSLWALEVLAELGFRYDSSIFPIRHDFYGMPDFPRFPCWHGPTNGHHLVEFPLSTFHLLGINFPVGGGGYLRILPLGYAHFGIQRINQREHHPVIVYFHPWEIDWHQPRLPVGLRSRLRHYTNLKTMEGRICNLLCRYSFASLRDLLACPNLLSEGQRE